MRSKNKVALAVELSIAYEPKLFRNQAFQSQAETKLLSETNHEQPFIRNHASLRQ